MKKPAKAFGYARLSSAEQAEAYSYVRFSSAEQARGDSLRRQTADTDAWCQRNGIRLNTTLTLRDLGVSAFKGRHRDDKHDLGKFLEAAQQGRVPRGSYLVIENLDRLSREDERTALRLWLDILDAGVNIVQLRPETVFRHERSDISDIIRAIIELSRGHSESRMKSHRLTEMWAQKRKHARDGRLLTRRLPAWVKVEEITSDGYTLSLVPERAEAVRRIFELAAAGRGHTAICRQLAEEGVLAFGARDRGEDGRYKEREGVPFGCGEWRRSYVGEILRDRRALGEFQPRTADGKPDGPPLAGYYPAVVTEAEFYAARAGAAERMMKPGRVGKNVANLFGGLLRNARDGGSYYVATRSDAGKMSKVLLNRGATEGKGPYWTFPYATFERAVLKLLSEVDPDDILGRPATAEDAAALAAELAWVRERRAALAEKLLGRDDLDEVHEALRKARDRETELAGRVEGARERDARPLGETWADIPALLDGTPPDDLEDRRLRVRAALRRVVESVWLLVVPRGRDRLCAVQVWFEGGKGHRDYLILHQSARGNGKARQDGRWWARALKLDAPGPLDLRKRADAEQLSAWLETAEL
jgi:DNA invertase Pin-like site-specific DNA recombinase